MRPHKDALEGVRGHPAVEQIHATTRVAGYHASVDVDGEESAGYYNGALFF